MEECQSTSEDCRSYLVTHVQETIPTTAMSLHTRISVCTDHICRTKTIQCHQCVCAALFTCFLLIIQNHPPEIVPKETTKPRFQNNRRAFGFTWGSHWQLWKTRAQPPWVFSPRCFDHLPVSASCRWQWLGFFSKRYSHFPGMVGSWDMKLTCFWVREAHD